MSREGGVGKKKTGDGNTVGKVHRKLKAVIMKAHREQGMWEWKSEEDMENTQEAEMCLLI